ncbi:pectate lyase [Duganella sp. Leaf126]|nr:pectate lyase [Duganella sp. Leaf126]
MAADKAALAAEREGTEAGTVAGAAAQPAPGNGMPLKNAADWYGSADALRIADNIVSYQTPAGGWGKNVNRDAPPRQKGEAYVHGDAGKPEGWSFVGTIDNDATSTELRFLARVIASGRGARQAQYRAAFVRGMEYLFNAQYPNGGFPQVYPLAGGYHDAITYNDNAIANVADLLDDVALRRGDYGFVSTELAARAAQSRDKAEQVIIASQIRIDGVPTGWCQQHDPVTLAPVGARNFEPIALVSEESARLLKVLMRDPAPTPAVVAAVDAGAAWLKRVAIYGQHWERSRAGGVLTPKAGAGPLWARFYDIATMRPVFGDRDRTIHTDVNELSPERRTGYAWYVSNPAATLDKYQQWARKFSPTGH